MGKKGDNEMEKRRKKSTIFEQEEKASSSRHSRRRIGNLSTLGRDFFNYYLDTVRTLLITIEMGNLNRHKGCTASKAQGEKNINKTYVSQVQVFWKHKKKIGVCRCLYVYIKIVWLLACFYKNFFF